MRPCRFHGVADRRAAVRVYCPVLGLLQIRGGVVQLVIAAYGRCRHGRQTSFVA